MTEYDDTDFDDDGGTIKSPTPLFNNFEHSSGEENGDLGTQLFSTGQLTQMGVAPHQQEQRLYMGGAGVPETIEETIEDCTPTIIKTNLSLTEPDTMGNGFRHGASHLRDN